MYGSGISKTSCLLDMGEDTGVIDRAGSWYSYGDERLGQGRENAKEFLGENSDLKDAVEREIRKKVGLGVEKESLAPGSKVEE